MEKPGVIKRSLSHLILKIYMFMSALIHNYSLQLKNILFNDLFGFIFLSDLQGSSAAGPKCL